MSDREEIRDLLGKEDFESKSSEEISVSSTKDSKWILNGLKEGNINPDDLKPEERRACLMRLYPSSLTRKDMAELFQVSYKTICRDINKIKTKIGREVEEADFSAIIGDLSANAEMCISEALKYKDYKTAWKIKKEYTEMLQSFGIIHKEPNKHVLSVESLEQKYKEHGREIILDVMDPAVTGEVIEEDDKEEDEEKPDDE